MTMTIENAAANLAEARQAAADAAAALAKGEAEKATVAARIDALASERASIQADRKAGNSEPGHGARLAIIQVDMETLGALSDEREASVVPLRAAEAEARRHVAAADHALERAEAGELVRRLVAHADQLDALLLRTLGELDDAAKRLGELRPMWAPTKTLTDFLRKLEWRRSTVARLAP